MKKEIHLLIGNGKQTACDLPFEESWLRDYRCTPFQSNCTCIRCLLAITSDEDLMKLQKVIIGEVS